MGIFLFVITLALEGAGGVWSFYYGSHQLGNLTNLINTALETRTAFRVTNTHLGWTWAMLYVLVHLAAPVASVKIFTKERLKLGHPGSAHIRTVDLIYRDLELQAMRARLPFRWPPSFRYIPGYDLSVAFLGGRLVIGEGLFAHRALKPLLVQQLFYYNSGDTRLRALLRMLPPAFILLPIGLIAGLPIAIGPVLMHLFWIKYWRDRVYAADLYAARLGQGQELMQALDQVVRPRERARTVLLRDSPYTAERIDRLLRWMNAHSSQTFSSSSAYQQPSGSSSSSGNVPPKGDASSGYHPPKAEAPSEKTSSSGASSSFDAFSRGRPPFTEQDPPRKKASFTGETPPPPRYSSSYRAGGSDRGRPHRVRLTLKYADQGWHVRWFTRSTEDFFATVDAFKETLDFHERYWDLEAFDGKGGWWVVYGALEKVGHLFSNYQAARDDLEREHLERYEQERQARERGTSGEKQQQKAGGKQREESRGQKQTSERGQQQSQRQQSREEVKLPKSVQEAFAILKLTPPVTKVAVKRAYRTLAFKHHPDHGGSHAQMVRINAAFEMAEKAAS